MTREEIEQLAESRPEYKRLSLTDMVDAFVWADGFRKGYDAANGSLLQERPVQINTNEITKKYP